MPNVDVRYWRGSLCSTVPHEKMVPGDFSELNNFVYGQDGLPMVRGGRRKWNLDSYEMGSGGDDATVQGLFHYRKSWVGTALEEFVVGVYDGKVWAANLRGGFTNLMPVSQLDESKPSFAIFKDYLFMASSSPTNSISPLYWNGEWGSVAVMGLGTPMANLIATHANRLWLVSKDDPSKMWCSAFLDPFNWNHSGDELDAHWFYVNPGDGNHISAMVPGFAGEMLIFKDGPGGGAIYRLSGLIPSEFQITPLCTTLGAVSHTVVSQVGDREIYFASRRGIHSLSRVMQHGDLESTYIDVEISDKWRNLTHEAQMRAVCADDMIHDTWWLMVDLDGDRSNDHGWLFNYRHRTPRGNPSISEVDYGSDAICVFGAKSSARGMLLAGSTSGLGRVYSENNPEANDDGTDFDWSAQLAPIDAGDAFRMKAWRKLWLNRDNWGEGKFDVTYWGDNRQPSTAAVEMNPSAFPTPHHGVQSAEFRSVPTELNTASLVHMSEGGKAINIKFSGTRGRIKLRGMRLDFTPEREDITADRWFQYTHAQVR